MFSDNVKIKFPRHNNSNTHYRLEEIQRTIERMWIIAARYESVLALMVAQSKEQGNYTDRSQAPQPKLTGDGFCDMTESVRHIQNLIVDHVIMAQGWTSFDWLRGIFLANIARRIPKIYPLFWLSLELAHALDNTEPPEVDYKQVKWIAQSGMIILPKHSFISRSGEEIKAISFFSSSEGEEVFVSCITDGELVRGMGVDLQSRTPRYLSPIVKNVIDLICMGNVIGRSALDPNDLVESTAVDEFLTARADSIRATNLLMALNLICVQHPNFIDAEVVPTSTKLGFGEKPFRQALKQPRWIGKQFYVKEQEITEESQRTQKYLRRGHWRLQSYGSGKDKHKKILWIEPKWVLSESSEDNRKRSSSFRSLVLKRYQPQCSLCDLTIEALIDAAHIIPFAEEGTDDPENGLPLCASHHTAFDRKFFIINPLTTEIISNSEYSLEELRIKHKNLSHLVNLPGKEFLQWRWDSDKTEKRPKDYSSI